jgi:DNA repair exonuclease SbcCD nuclease subunit
MGLKVLFMGDNHCDSLQPPWRTDNYCLTTSQELLESLEIARDNSCDAFVLLGDVFNRAEVGGECRNLVLKTLKKGNNGDGWPFPIYVVVGNHDIAHDPSNLGKSALGTMIDADLLIKTDYDDDLGIAFGHFVPHNTKLIKEGELMKEPALIWAVHASVTTRSIHGDFVLFEDVPLAKKTKLLIAGHVHFPMDQVRKDGKRFINPGNVGRYDATKDNINREINVLLVDYERDGSRIDTQLIPLKTCLPGKDIFKIDKIQKKKDKKAEEMQFIKQTGKLSGWVNVSSGDKYVTLRQSGKIKKLDVRVVDKAVETLREVNDKRK